ncbi:MAG: zinc ABC transporter substrate-binding protein [Candidatus Muirbacterium halophilum]|nr:zinc ABC transporter substrate-binding protein [Candidatus Muirbacterium halophilum]MCK9476038.1 zinc ABC transporter substrate-binding protein [Candidatus Muirbacterium halophilum]
MNRFYIILYLLFFVFGTFSLNIGVSIPPEKYFIEKIAGNEVNNIIVIIKPGMSAHNFEITPKQLVNLSKADIYFAIGLEFENILISKIKNINKNIFICDLSEEIEKINMKNHFHHNEDEDFVNKIKDPHIWLSVNNVQKMSQKILKILIQKYPNKKSIFLKNYNDFILHTVNIDFKIKTILNKNILNRNFIVFHPSWGYFAKDYNLNQIPIEIEGKEPNASELKEILDISRELHISTVFVEPYHQSNSPKVIAEFLKAKIRQIYPLAEKWDENLIEVAQKIRESVEK